MQYFIWQEDAWRSLMSRRDRLPHALLLRGRPGIGKHLFAYEFARTILCRSPSNGMHSCEQCPSCLWFKEGNHPDFRLISPDADEPDDKPTKTKSFRRGQIGVAQIRQLSEYLSLSNHEVNGMRVILISPADTLNASSANALLKILEEPPSNTLFLLVSSQPHRLLATIMSRCQALAMLPPSPNQAVDWLISQGVASSEAENALHYAGGAPLLALQMLEQHESRASITSQLQRGGGLDCAFTATKLLALGMEQGLEALQKWVFDLFNYTLTRGVRYHPQYVSALQALAKSVNLSLLLRLQETLANMKLTADHPLNNEMQLELALLQYTQVFSTRN